MGHQRLALGLGKLTEHRFARGLPAALAANAGRGSARERDSHVAVERGERGLGQPIQ
jgi:hypothetical protein